MAKQMRASAQLFNGTKPIGARETEALKASAKPLVDRLKEQAKLKTKARNRQYEARLRRCMAALNAAHEASRIAAARLEECNFDREDARQIDHQLFEAIGTRNGFFTLRTQVVAGSDNCRLLANTMSDVTGVQENRPKGRPASKYVDETRELIKFFETVTKKRVVSPKQVPRMPSASSHQPSTEFIRLRLQEIDPNVTLSEAITCIICALKPMVLRPRKLFR